ncbi:MAG: tetratricopeptide repeat protein [Nitrospirae bacterium]|nr:tetratricopeptide repeat protein [Nitrospirota bacterium]
MHRIQGAEDRVQKKNIEDTKIRRWDDKKSQLLIFSTSQLLMLCLLFTVYCLLFTGCVTTPSVEKIQMAQVHYKLGLAYLTEDRIQEAFVEFQKSIALNPEDKESLNALGLIYTKLEKYSDAISSYRKAIMVDSKFSEAHNNLGVTYTKLEQWDEAIKSFQLALKNPLYATPDTAYSNMGLALYKKGEYLKAMESTKEALKRSPNFHYPLYVLGLIYVKLDKNKDAIGVFSKAVTIDPHYIEAHWELANAYLREGDKKRAIEHFRKVAESGIQEKSKEALKYIEILK